MITISAWVQQEKKKLQRRPSSWYIRRCCLFHRTLKHFISQTICFIPKWTERTKLPKRLLLISLSNYSMAEWARRLVMITAPAELTHSDRHSPLILWLNPLPCKPLSLPLSIAQDSLDFLTIQTILLTYYVISRGSNPHTLTFEAVPEIVTWKTSVIKIQLIQFPWVRPSLSLSNPCGDSQ